MSSSTKVGKDTSLQGGVLHQTFRDLLKQREALDHQILRLQGRFFKMMEKSTKIKLSTKLKYVSRMKNDKTLKEAVLCVMVPGRKMNMDEILSTIEREKAYHTRSHGIYTMVNNKLHEMRRKGTIERVSRGVFLLQKKRKRTGRSKKVA